jgi:Ribose/xylose/arabinose/galactoside ABC-type transport systems, permease components
MTENRLNRSEFVGKYGVYFIIVVLLIIGAFVSDKFFSSMNIINILESVSFLGITAAGMALVTYSGQSVDLSGPSVIAVAGFVSIMTLGLGLVVSFVLALAVGAAIGLMNGLVVGKFRMNTVIWTLAVTFVATGLIRVIFGSSNIYPDTQPNSAGFENIALTNVFGVIPVSIIIMVVLLIMLHIIVSKSKYGAKLKMLGSAEEAAKFTGINVTKVICSTFVISSICAALTGIFIASMSKSAAYSYGTGYDFKGITAIVLSGVVLDGGKGSILGVLGGVLSIGLLNNILTLVGVNSFLQDVVIGGVFILIVWFTSFSAKKMEEKYA